MKNEEMDELEIIESVSETLGRPSYSIKNKKPFEKSVEEEEK